jgi:hypothetical protein
MLDVDMHAGKKKKKKMAAGSAEDKRIATSKGESCMGITGVSK